MLQQKIYFTLLDLCWMYTLFKGGPPERIGATILALGSALTVAALSGPTTSYMSVEIGVFLVDVACLAGFLILALRAERYWPLWIAGLQLVGTAAHAVKLVDPDVIRRAYAFALVFWSYPMLLLIALGTYRHQQRVARFGADRSWSSSWGLSARPPGAGPTG
jgi:hypothetical protein